MCNEPFTSVSYISLNLDLYIPYKMLKSRNSLYIFIAQTKVRKQYFLDTTTYLAKDLTSYAKMIFVFILGLYRFIFTLYWFYANGEKVRKGH